MIVLPHRIWKGVEYRAVHLGELKKVFREEEGAIPAINVRLGRSKATKEVRRVVVKLGLKFPCRYCKKDFAPDYSGKGAGCEKHCSDECRIKRNAEVQADPLNYDKFVTRAKYNGNVVQLKEDRFIEKKNMPCFYGGKRCEKNETFLSLDRKNPLVPLYRSNNCVPACDIHNKGKFGIDRLVCRGKLKGNQAVKRFKELMFEVAAKSRVQI